MLAMGFGSLYAKTDVFHVENLTCGKRASRRQAKIGW